MTVLFMSNNELFFSYYRKVRKNVSNERKEEEKEGFNIRDNGERLT